MDKVSLQDGPLKPSGASKGMTTDDDSGRIRLGPPPFPPKARPTIEEPKSSDVLHRVRAFLPQLEQANALLDRAEERKDETDPKPDGFDLVDLDAEEEGDTDDDDVEVYSQSESDADSNDGDGDGDGDKAYIEMNLGLGVFEENQDAEKENKDEIDLQWPGQKAADRKRKRSPMIQEVEQRLEDRTGNCPDSGPGHSVTTSKGNELINLSGV